MDFSSVRPGLAQIFMFVLELEGPEKRMVRENKKMIKIQTAPNAHAKFMAQEGLEGI